MGPEREIADVAFPKVLDQMNEQLDWTQKLGDAFLAQQKDVMDGVQPARQARKRGQPEVTGEER